MESQTVTLQGHIIDSLILAKVVDTIVMLGGTFTLSEVTVGTKREDLSHAKIHIAVRGKARVSDPAQQTTRIRSQWRQRFINDRSIFYIFFRFRKDRGHCAPL